MFTALFKSTEIFKRHKTRIMITKLNPFFLLIVIFPFAAFAQGGIEVQTGTHLIVSSSTSKIVLAEAADFNNNGTFTHGDGEVIFLGNVDQEVKGTSTSSFYDLEINKSAGDLLASTDFNVDNELKMTNGHLDLQDATVDLGTTGNIIDETESNRIKVGDISSNTGTIQATRTLDNVTDFNPGNLGVLITTDQNLGSITVVRGHHQQEGSGDFTGNYSIARYYEVPGIGKLDANNQLQLQYWDAELNGYSEADLEIYHWVIEGSAPGWWTPLQGTVGSNLVSSAAEPYSDYFDPPNWYTFNFSELFTIGSKDNPLPIELLAFDVKWRNENQQDAIVSWVTATEINNDYFVVERSADAVNWEKIETKPGAGNANYELQYEIIDKQPLDGNSYYRLKQVDFDGTTTYSDIRSLFKNMDNIDLIVFPNPTSEVIYIQFGENPESNLKIISLYDQSGKIVRQLTPKNKSASDWQITNNAITIDISQFAPGTYNISIITDRNITNHKIVIN
jgi:hypothetical protein